MSILKTPPRYGSRSVKEWLAMAGRGDVLLPNFQRSFVWKPQQTADYLHALLEKRPTGIFLILEAEHPLPFACRLLHRAGPEAEDALGSPSTSRELVLDGQQRLTSLWGALRGRGPKRYLIRVNDLFDKDPRVEQIVWRSHAWSTPAKMCRENLVPADILGSEPGDISRWCQQGAGDEWLALHDTATKLRERLLTEPQLQYCLLQKDTGRDTAIDIFINVNKSAVKLKEVDIAVAIAEADHGEDLRTRVANYLERSIEVGHYFSPDPKRAIPEVAEWMLKVGCLKVRDGLPPSATHYPSAVKHLCGSADADATASGRRARLDQLEADLDSALDFAARRGGATKRTLPTWPPVHVIAALQDDVRKAGPGLKEKAERLLSAYLWRAFVTERYAKLANTRLLEDFRALREYLCALADWKAPGGTKPDLAVPAFDTGEYKLPTVRQLMQAGWIGRASRLGRAIAAVAMRECPRDWTTGKTLDSHCVRQLELAGKLERRHVFPPALFEANVEWKIQLGLNGVLLAKSSPPLEQCDPADLLAHVRELQPETDELGLRQRVHSHQVPWLALARDGAAASFRYHRYLKERAESMVTKMRELATY